MAAAARKLKPQVAQPKTEALKLPTPPAWPVEAGANHAPIASPAHQLIVGLDRQLQLDMAPDPVVRKWPPALSLAILVGSSAALWGGVALAARLLIH